MARRFNNNVTTPLDAGNYDLEIASMLVQESVLVPARLMGTEEDCPVESFLLTLKVEGEKGFFKSRLQFNLGAFLDEDGELKENYSVNDLRRAYYGYDRKIDALDRIVHFNEDVEVGEYDQSVVGKTFGATIEPQVNGFIRLVYIGDRWFGPNQDEDEAEMISKDDIS